MNVASVDTNVLLRALITQDAEQSRAARALLTTDGWVFRVDLLVFAEFVHALDRHYGQSRPRIAEMVRAVVNLDRVECAAEVVLGAVARYLDHPKLSFEDCCLAERARRDGAVPLWTFDRKLAAQADCARLVGG